MDRVPHKVAITLLEWGKGCGWLTPMALNKHPSIYPSNFPLSRNLFLFSEPTGFLGSRHKGPSVSARTSRGPHSNIVKSLKIVWHGGLTYGRVHEACQKI